MLSSRIETTQRLIKASSRNRTGDNSSLTNIVVNVFIMVEFQSEQMKKRVLATVRRCCVLKKPCPNFHGIDLYAITRNGPLIALVILFTTHTLERLNIMARKNLMDRGQRV